MKKYTRSDAAKLFAEIEQLFYIPFTRLEPLKVDLPVTAPPEPTKPPEFDLFKGLGKKCTLDLSKEKLPKTRAEVDELFEEIENYCRIQVPFRLTGLDNVDALPEASFPVDDSEITQKPQISKPRRSQRVAQKSSHGLTQSPFDEKNCFATLMFGTKLQRNVSTKEELPSTITPTPVAKPQTSTPLSITGKTTSQQQHQPPPPRTTPVVNTVPVSKPPLAPFCLSSTLNLKESLKSCRSYLSRIKPVSTPTIVEEKQASASVLKPINTEDLVIKKRRNTRKRATVVLTTTITSVAREDSIESGYSSGQSSVPSPAPSSLFSTELDELYTKYPSSSISSSSTYSSSRCSTPSLSVQSFTNPNGEVIYLRSQLDNFLEKTAATGRGAKKKAVGGGSRPSPLLQICDKQRQQQRKQLQPPHPTRRHPTVPDLDRHQKVIEWQCKTLLANSCPTPTHENLMDVETPPNTPGPVATQQRDASTFLPTTAQLEDNFVSLPLLFDEDNQTNVQSPTTTSALDDLNDELLDFDCLQDFAFDNQQPTEVLHTMCQAPNNEEEQYRLMLQSLTEEYDLPPGQLSTLGTINTAF